MHHQTWTLSHLSSSLTLSFLLRSASGSGRAAVYAGDPGHSRHGKCRKWVECANIPIAEQLSITRSAKRTEYFSKWSLLKQESGKYAELRSPFNTRLNVTRHREDVNLKHVFHDDCKVTPFCFPASGTVHSNERPVHEERPGLRSRLLHHSTVHV